MGLVVVGPGLGWPPLRSRVACGRCGLVSSRGTTDGEVGLVCYPYCFLSCRGEVWGVLATYNPYGPVVMWGKAERDLGFDKDNLDNSDDESGDESGFE